METRKEIFNPIEYMVEQITDPLYNALVMEKAQQNLESKTKVSYAQVVSAQRIDSPTVDGGIILGYN